MKFSGSGKASTGGLLLELRPMSVVELVDNALEVCSRHVGALAATVLPGYLLLGAAILLLISYAEMPPAGYTEEGFGFYFLLGGLATIFMFISHVSHGAGVFYLYRAETGLPVTAASAMGKALKRSGSLVLISAVTYMVAGLGAFLFLIPGIAAYSIFALCTPVAMVEDVTYMRTIKRGYKMLRDFFPRSFKAHVLLGVLWLVMLLTLHLTVIIGLMIARSFLDLEVGVLAKAFTLGNLTYLALLNVAILLGFSGVFSALSVLLYIDVRVRTEGIDIERRIAALPEIKERARKAGEVAA